MKTLNDARLLIGISIPELSDVVGISYYDLSEMLKGHMDMPTEVKEKAKIFLLQNYTKCIEKL